MIRRKQILKGVRFSTRGSSAGSSTLGSAATDSQSTGDGTPTQSAEEVPATPADSCLSSAALYFFNMMGC
ncbi:hypothetical protein ERO13_A08G252566v2 [Gossypium hirsutum]|uniref:Uncharacterized protein n=1 Tax=Gossypium darwinii TaxID=34276 RepID=A0A5D2FR64_GOSDA|nr:hypothetical protein ERO13_A08G252566v2 [Gossypium hirsutum]TYH08221.1 hypothetical protein ES288_A08G298900v1 [Gossypium darwinii]